MKNINYLVVFLFLFIIACNQNSSTNKTAPLSVSQENPNYFEYNGKPVILISSTEHYFAMINRKFDLTKWDENYFDRLEEFVAYASERDIFVNYIFFTPLFDDHKWHATPLNPSNNVNAEFEKTQPFDIYTLDKHLGLLDLQKELIRRMTQRLKKYPNVFYEVTFDGGANWTKPDWHRYMFTAKVYRFSWENTHFILDGNLLHPATPTIRFYGVAVLIRMLIYINRHVIGAARKFI
jgi:hypothetical protein